MKFIHFEPEKCDECFKCLRVCPTKAIAFTNKNHHIIDDLCIKCGICQMHCPQGALTIQLDIESVQRAIKTGKKVVASIAPSYAGAFSNCKPEQLYTALKQIGFYAAEETARGAELVSQQYEKVISKGKKQNIITSCCPSSNYLIEHYYPSSIDSVIPTVSPMLAHGYDIKSRYGEDTYVVFIGPCLAKKAEAVEIPDAIDAVITFRELENWFDEQKLDIPSLPLTAFDTPVTKRGRAYPLGGSLWKADLKTRINPQYEYIHIDGIENCKAFLEAIEQGEISGFCAELNICNGSCINGPDMPKQSPNLFKRRQKVKAHALEAKKSDKEEVPSTLDEAQLTRTFESKASKHPPVNDFAVAEVLMKMGKYTEQDQLNCNACGYSTCYEKAVAVTKGYSDINMCLDTLRKKAEGLQSIIFEASPNAICILDNELRIQAVNPSFHNLFNSSRIKLNYWPIAALIEDTIFDELSAQEDNHLSKKIYLESVDKSFYSNLVRINDGKIIVGIFTDITQEENNRQELERVKEETITTCQEVIDHQMRIAQEIASLLGETTAETKIGLNKLKKLVLSDGGDLK